MLWLLSWFYLSIMKGGGYSLDRLLDYGMMRMVCVFWRNMVCEMGGECCRGLEVKMAGLRLSVSLAGQGLCHGGARLCVH